MNDSGKNDLDAVLENLITWREHGSGMKERLKKCRMKLNRGQSEKKGMEMTLVTLGKEE